jgi:predicted lipoprotein with Yx(FWY)xxD motif
MKTTLPLALVVSALVVGNLAGCSSAATTGAPVASQTGAKTASISLGKIIVKGSGLTAYFFDHDHANSAKSACTGACSGIWTAITSSSKTPTISGATGTVGTIPDGSGKYQITVNGMPIYRYSIDAAAGDTKGQGTGGIWWVAGADGKEIKKAASGGGY